MKQRASHLPDVSVEQMFLSGESFAEGKSRYFTVRTTEKQPELVRASLDRLLARRRPQDIAHVRCGDDLPGGEGRDREALPVAVNGTIDLEFSKPTSRELRSGVAGPRVPNRAAGADRYRYVHTDRGGRARGRPLHPDETGRVEEPSLRLTRGREARPGEGQGTAGAAARFSARCWTGTKRTFDATPEPERLEVFDSQLATETRTKAFYAIVASWIAILLYLWFRFGNWTFGLAAVLCLVHDLCFTLGAIAVCHYLHLIPGLSFLGHRGLQDRPRGSRGAAHAGRLLGERDHRELRPDPRGPRQEPAC